MVTLETKFNLGEMVRVTLNDDFIGTIIAVHADIKEAESRIWYEVALPEDKRGRGRYYSESWAYGEQYLQKAN